MKSLENYNGILVLTDNKGVGQLEIKGPESRITILSSEPFTRARSEDLDIFGALPDGTKVSLLNCIESSFSSNRDESGVRYVSKLFPHFVIAGARHLRSADIAIKAVRYHFENIDCFVGGYDTFRLIHPDREEAIRLLEAEHTRHHTIAEKQGWPTKAFNPEVGEHPTIMMFSGKHAIVRCEPDIGTVTLTNHATYGSGSSKGIALDNEIAVALTFNESRSFKQMIDVLHRLHSLFELNLGRRQRYRWIEVEFETEDTTDSPTRPEFARVYWSYCNDRVRRDPERTHINDVLLDPEDRPDEFRTVLASWLNTEPEMGDARTRFASGFNSSYGIDRIVGAANMFDILPPSHAPKKRCLSEDVVEAKKKCRDQFRKLPDSFARQSILDALGRIGNASLRDKIRTRAQILIDIDQHTFRELFVPCDEAVRCRNHYVHGSEAAFDYNIEHQAFLFLVDTLEFVFAVSDLVDLGWDFAAWRKKGSTLSHPLGNYLVGYEANIDKLKSLSTRENKSS